MAKQLNARIITKHDTEANWEKALTFKPKLGEIIIYETPEKVTPNEFKWETIPRIKIGDGNNTINNLPFIIDACVLKREGYDLSQRNYTVAHERIVDKIAKLGYEPKYTDTTYTAGKGIGLKVENGENVFYNTGIISIQGSEKNGFIKYRLNTGLNNDDYREIEIGIPGLQQTAFTPLSNFLTSDSLIKINNSITKIEPSTTPGSLKYTNAVGETSQVAVPGLGKLAFKDGFDGDFIEVVEVVVQSWQPIDKIPIWINNETSIIKFYDIVSNTYKDISAGVTKIEKINSSTLKIDTNGNTENISIAPEFSVSEGTTNGTIQITLNGSSYTGKVKGLSANAYSTDSFLKLTGGTVTGNTVFSSSTASNSTSTGAVRITGGLGVRGNIYGNKVYGSVWNDYAEYRQSEEPIEPGYIVYSSDDGILHKTMERLQSFEGVVSDTFGFSIGKTDKAQTPLAVAGRVLVYTDEELHAGNVVCAGPHGKACRMTKQEIKDHPDRIVGVVSEVPSYETWGEENISVNGRVWIRVK